MFGFRGCHIYGNPRGVMNVPITNWKIFQRYRKSKLLKEDMILMSYYYVMKYNIRSVNEKFGNWLLDFSLGFFEAN